MMGHVWTYWEGERSPFIQLCLDSIELHNPGFCVYGPDDVASMGLKELLAPYSGLPHAQRCDLLRFAIMAKIGGLWVDADTICVAPFDRMQEVDACDLWGCYNPTQTKGWGVDGLLASPFSMRQGSPLAKTAITACRGFLNRMVRGQHVSYGQTSVGILSWLWKSRRETNSVLRRQHWRYCRVPWWRARNVFLSRSAPHGHEQNEAWSPLSVFYHVTNPIFRAFRAHDRESVLHGKCFASWLFQKSFGMEPAIFGRATELLVRLPDGPVRVAEIGVFRGIMSSHLLQQRRDLNLTMVDGWGIMRSTYPPTGDYQALFGSKRWKRVRNEALARTEFAKERRSVVQGDSEAVAARIPDGSLDIVFIDGDHSYDGCKRDILAWRGKIRSNGWIGGHDYGHPKESTGKYGVKKAVDEIFSPVETGRDGSWWVQMKGNTNGH